MHKEPHRTRERAPYPGSFDPPKEAKGPLPKNSFTTPTRELASDESPNFFDLLRIKNLGGELNKAHVSPQAPKIPLPSFVKENKSKGPSHASIRASQGKSQEEKSGRINQARPKTVNHADSRAAHKPNPEGDRLLLSQKALPANAPGKELNKKELIKKELNDKERKTQERNTKEQRESGFILSIKWIVKLLFSLVFLVWIFILGVLVGRGSMQENPNIVSQSINPPSKVTASKGAFSAGPDYDFAGMEEPGVMEYPFQNPYQTPYQAAYPDAGGSYGEGGVLEESFDAERIAPSPPPEPKNYSPPYLNPEAELISKSSEEIDSPSISPAPVNSSNDSSISKDVLDDDPGYWPEAPIGNGSYTVQVGSPASKEEAQRMVEKYRDKGFDAYYYPKGAHYPTRVGRFVTKDAAEVARTQLEKEGAVGPYVSKLNH